MSDWIRSLALDTWPWVAIGTASGGVFVADLEEGEVVAGAFTAHPAHLESAAEQMSLLTEYDGGGVTAIAFKRGVVVSGGREGTAKVWYVAGMGTRRELVQRGTLECEGVVSAVLVTEGTQVWVASLDGTLRRWDAVEHSAMSSTEQPDSEEPGVHMTPSAFESSIVLRLDAPVLCATADEERNLLACGLANGKVALFALDTGAALGSWCAHEGARARAIEICHDAIFSGGSDGTVARRWLAGGGGRASGEEGETVLDESRDAEELQPPHRGPVVTLHGRSDSILVSGAHDGSVRVWDVAPVEGGTARCLYGLLGYKVWLSALGVDANHLVSDGSDNCVIVHDFSDEAAERGGQDDGSADDDVALDENDDDDDPPP